MRPGIETSLELHAWAQRSVGVGGEHNAWWMKRAWWLAREVAAMLVAMAMWGTAEQIQGQGQFHLGKEIIPKL